MLFCLGRQYGEGEQEQLLLQAPIDVGHEALLQNVINIFQQSGSHPRCTGCLDVESV